MYNSYGEDNANYLNLQPLRGCFYWGDCRYPHVADCASLIVNMGLLRLQPLCGCASCACRGGDMTAAVRVVVIRVLCGRFFGGWRCVRGLRYRSPTAKSRRHPASGVTSFGRPFRRRFRELVRAYGTECKLSESATAPRLCILGLLPLSPRSRLRFAYRQHGVIEVAAAPRLCGRNGLSWTSWGW